MTNVNGKFMFEAYGGLDGQNVLAGLWISDGTPAGTKIVKTLPTRLWNFVASNGVLYFTYGWGGDLWRSDGTAAGTYLLKTMNSSGGFFDANGTLYFVAGAAASRLHKSDGTADGTVGVSDVTVVGEMTHVNGIVYFVGNDGVHGNELWRSDGTAAGTYMVEDTNPDQTIMPSWLTSYQNTLLYAAVAPDLGLSLWRTQNTEAGASPVTPVNARTGNSDPDQIAATSAIGPNGTVYFVADDKIHGRELWISDGTAPGTKLLADIHPGAAGSSISSLTMVNETLFFTVDDPVCGPELWKSDGTTEGTRLVRDINPGGGGSSPQYLTAVDDLLYFIAYDDNHGMELWKSDGTEAGTVLVRDMVAGPREPSWGHHPP